MDIMNEVLCAHKNGVGKEAFNAANKRCHAQLLKAWESHKERGLSADMRVKYEWTWSPFC